MAQETRSSYFQEVLETVESLPLDEQAMLVEIIQRRVRQHRREQLVKEIAEAREAYQLGDVGRGTVNGLMLELSE